MRFSSTVKKFGTTMLACVAGGSVAIVFSYWLKKSPTVEDVSTAQHTTSDSSSVEDTLDTVQPLLADSILSIIQNYYVDADRVDPRNLLKVMLRTLDGTPRVKVEQSGQMVLITSGSEKRSFKVPEPLTFDALAEFLSRIAPVFDQKPSGNNLVADTGQNSRGSTIIMNALLMGLDAHSSLLTPDAYRELRQGTDGAFGGLGVLVGIRDQILTVVKPLPNSPALRAGIRKHDRILSINEKFTFGFALDQLVEFMRGDPGTKVDLRLLRDEDKAPMSVSLKREVIQVDSVASTEIRDGENSILHLTVDSFASRTSKEVWAAIRQAKANKHGKLEGLILDLRSNPGGLLDQAVQIADMFLKSGVIVSTKGRRQEVESADSGYDEVDYPIVILMDSDSASASEIVAGALQDHGRALVVGQPSFGKGSVQTIFELPNDFALKLTIARYYTPSGRSIQNVGIMPDIWLQPVLRKASNENLFGNFRYKNERFLLNHLDESIVKNILDQNGPETMAYYLREPSENSDDPKLPDRELEMAVKIIKKTAKAYGPVLPLGMRRASHWMALASKEIREFADSINKSTAAWTEQKFKVDWNSPPGRSTTPLLSLNVGENLPKAVHPGDSISIPWRIENRGDKAAGHISLFVRSDRTSFDTREVLVGMIEPGTNKEGTLSVYIPTYWEPGDLDFTFGIAQDSQILTSPTKAVDLIVESRNAAKLTATLDLIDEHGGKLAGTLEAGEKAKLMLHIINRGATAAKALSAQLINLAGKQLLLDTGMRSVVNIPPGGVMDVPFDVTAADQIYSRELFVGISLQSNDLELPLRKQAKIAATPTAMTSESLAH